MPAGDAGLERQAIHDGMGPSYAVPREWLTQAERVIDRLQVQLAAQQTVVDAAREFVDNDPCRYDHNDYCQTHYGQRPCHMERLRAALEVQAAQPEGERAC